MRFFFSGPVFMGAILTAQVASAELTICNETGDDQDVSVGYKDGDEWVSEGWWFVASGDCVTPVEGDLGSRYYYYRSEIQGGDFEGGGYMFCTTPEAYTIIGDADCDARGYDREDFEVIDTGKTARSYTFVMNEGQGGLASASNDNGLHFCNDTEYSQSVSIGYEGDDGWTSEGWWNIDPGDCSTPLAGDLQKQYYYYRAEVDGGDFEGGGYSFCTEPDAYTIVGDTNCAARGYDSEDFAEINTGRTSKTFTFVLNDQSGGQVASRSRSETKTENGLHFCNETDVTQEVSVGYNGDEDWTSEGWWNIEPGDCATPLPGDLQKRYYYYRAEVDGGDFNGEGYSFCTTPEAYTIVGDVNCTSRGYDSEDFAEIDTGSTAVTFTFILNDQTGGETSGSWGSSSGSGLGSSLAGGSGGGSSDGYGLTFCNETTATQSVSVGYEGDGGWTSEGWWNVDPGECATPISGSLGRYYYYRAEIDGGEFDGEGYMFCTTTEAYTIVGDENCKAQGYDRESFSEIDLGAPKDGHTFTLTALTGGLDDGGHADGGSGGDGDGLHFCNKTDETQVISIGYDSADGWISEGWWPIDPGDCATPVTGQLNQYYYYRAEVDAGDFDGGGYMFCTSPDVYTIVGDINCQSRGYDLEDFAEINLGAEEWSYTFNITPETGGHGSGSLTPSGGGGGTTSSGSKPGSGGSGSGSGTSAGGSGNNTRAGGALVFCNETNKTQSLALGYDGPRGWTSEGWWQLEANDCEQVVPRMGLRYYYYRAEQSGGDTFEGDDYFFCTTQEEFEIVGSRSCKLRGFDQKAFRMIDTGRGSDDYYVEVKNR